jgi:hypothetical protein
MSSSDTTSSLAEREPDPPQNLSFGFEIPDDLFDFYSPFDSKLTPGRVPQGPEFEETPLSRDEAYELGRKNLIAVEKLEQGLPPLLTRILNNDEYLEALYIWRYAHQDPEAAFEAVKLFVDKKIEQKVRQQERDAWKAEKKKLKAPQSS